MSDYIGQQQQTITNLLDNENISVSIKLRDYQDNAVYEITKCINSNNKCIVKMFCGTGKTTIMLYYVLIENYKFSVFVFPSIALITQFNKDYLQNKDWNITANTMSICSKDEVSTTSSIENSLFTTDSVKISQFLSNNDQKIICVTYDSYKTLFHNMIETNCYPGITTFDEAHHVVENKVRDFIFRDDFRGNRVFYTATPRNDYGISMEDGKDCGPYAFSYTHHCGVNDGYLNDFEILVDFSGDNDIYRKIARAILKTGNTRVLTFHTRINDIDTSVREFVDEQRFIQVFKDVCLTEFPNFDKKYSSIRMYGIDSNTKNRPIILNHLDEALDDEVVIISSCKTIREGVDTKNANMCVFIDPKTSFVDIIQNIGRIVRPQPHTNISTVLIPVCVDRTHHNENHTNEERDKIIREDMSKNGNYNTILNVMSALKQEDPELFDMCLHYPKKFTDYEMKDNFDKQGVSFFKKTLTDSEFEEKVNQNTTTRFEIHTPDVEQPIVIKNGDIEHEKIEKYWKDNNNVYHKMNAKSSNKKNINPPPSSSSKKKLTFHTDDDMKVLWNITDNDMFTQNMCGAIESKIENYDHIKNAEKRANQLIKFHIEKNREPLNNKGETNEDIYEKKLHKWRDSYKNGCKCKYESVNNILQNSGISDIVDYFFGNKDESIHIGNVTKYIEYTRENGRPVNKDKKHMNFNETERSLCNWASDYKQYMRFESVNEIIQNCGITELLDYFYNSNNIKNTELLLEYVNNHNELPPRTDNLYKWLVNRRQSYKATKKNENNNDVFKSMFKSKIIKKFLLTGDELTEQTLIKRHIENAYKYIEYVNTNKKRPPKYSCLYNWAYEYKRRTKCKYESVNAILVNSDICDIITYFGLSKDLPPESSRQAEERGKQESDSTLPIKQNCNHKWTEVGQDGDLSIKKCDLCGRRQSVNRCGKTIGYREPNPEKKLEINQWFQNGYKNYLQGKAVILDAKGMKSTHSLIASGKFSVEDVIVPEYCDDTSEENSREFPEFSSCICSGTYLDVLMNIPSETISVMYADFTGHFEKWVEPLLTYLKERSTCIRSGTVLVITWSDNGKKNKESQHKSSKYLGAFEEVGGWTEMESSPQELGYGLGGNMNVRFYKKN